MRSLLLGLLCLSCTPVSLPFLTTTSVRDTSSLKNVSYVSSYDGDTFTVNLSTDIPEIFSRGMAVRVKGIDAAEMTSKDKCEYEMAQKAKDVTHKVLTNSVKLDLDNVQKDKYFRLLADVTVHHKTLAISFSLSTYLLERGLVVPYDGKTKPKVDWCKMLPKQSRSKK